LQSQNYGSANYFSIHNSVGFSGIEHHSNLNPSAIALDTSNYVIFRSKPSRFGLKELSPIMLSSKLEIDSNISVGLNFSGVGGDLYSEIGTEAKLSYKISEIVIIGTSLELNHLAIKNYNSQILYFVNIGGILKLSSNLNAGFALRNILRNYAADYDKTVYLESIFGLAYTLDSNLTVDVDAVVSLNTSSSLNFGVKYILAENISTRFAVRTNPGFYEFASMLQITPKFGILLGAGYNSILGISPEILIKYNI
jgi:hypothetical protein